jgi:hypothetical protein
MTMAVIELPDGLDPADLAALRLAFAQSRASSKAQARQLDWMAKERSWQDAAEFAAFDRQIDNMGLRPWETPPCCVADENEPRVGEEVAAKILRCMLKAGVSRWHPNPLAALEASEKT